MTGLVAAVAALTTGWALTHPWWSVPAALVIAAAALIAWSVRALAADQRDENYWDRIITKAYAEHERRTNPGARTGRRAPASVPGQPGTAPQGVTPPGQ